jgi:hypothetical protein
MLNLIQFHPMKKEILIPEIKKKRMYQKMRIQNKRILVIL